MKESKEIKTGAEKPMSENIWGWRWSWISLGIIIFGLLFMLIVGPKEVEEGMETESEMIDTIKLEQPISK